MDSNAGRIDWFFPEQKFHRIWENPVCIKFPLLATARFSREFGENKDGWNTLETTLSEEDAKNLSHLRLHVARIKQRTEKPSALYMLFDHSIIKHHH